MRRLLLSLLTLLVVVWALDRTVGTGMKRLFQTSTVTEDGDVLGRGWRYQAPIVVCGSSRAAHHYVVDSLASILGVKAYNLGRDGSGGPVFMYGVSGIVTRHYAPKIWIMDIGSAIEQGPVQTGRLACFLPYVDDEPVAREVVAMRSKHESVRLWSRIYRYNSLILSLLSPRLGKPVTPRLGFLPLHGDYAPTARAVLAEKLREPAPQPAPVDSVKLRYLRRAIDLMHKRGVTVLAVRSPRYLETPGDERYSLTEEREMEELFGKLNVRYMDFSVAHIDRFRDPHLFVDPAHLNEAGALIFTRMLADSLRAAHLGV
jgi:hypothetical protein